MSTGSEWGGSLGELSLQHDGDVVTLSHRKTRGMSRKQALFPALSERQALFPLLPSGDYVSSPG